MVYTEGFNVLFEITVLFVIYFICCELLQKDTVVTGDPFLGELCLCNTS